MGELGNMKMEMNKKKMEKSRLLEEKIQKIRQATKQLHCFYAYYDKEVQDTEIVVERLKNSNSVLLIRKKYSIPPKGIVTLCEEDGLTDLPDVEERWWKSLTYMQRCEFEKDLGNLMAELKIPQNRYGSLVEDFVKESENIDPNFSTLWYETISPVEAGLRENPLTGRAELILTLDANAKKKDLSSPELWEQIKYLQKQLPDYGSMTQTKKRNLKQLKQMYDWHVKDGLTYREINKKRTEIGLNQHPDYQSVGTEISRYKKLVGAN